MCIYKYTHIHIYIYIFLLSHINAQDIPKIGMDNFAPSLGRDQQGIPQSSKIWKISRCPQRVMFRY